MLLVSNEVEFRNIKEHNGKNGNYFTANFEDEQGQPFEVYLGKSTDSVRELVKGDKCALRFDYNQKYKNLNLVSVC